MTSLSARALSDTTLPGLQGRRVWSAPAVASHAGLVMTPSRLYLLPAGHPAGASLRAAAEAGADLERLFGDAAEGLNLADVRRADFHLADLTIVLARPAGDVTLRFGDAEAADDVFTKLLHRTRDRLRLVSDKPDPWVAARGPLGLLAGVLLATATLAVTASAAADLTTPDAPAWLARWLSLLAALDWRAVGGVGGAVAAWLQVAAYRRYHRPPARLALVAADGSPHSTPEGRDS